VSGWKLEKTTAFEESLLVGECWLSETPAMTPFERNNQQRRLPLYPSDTISKPWMLLEKLKSTTPGQALYFYPLYVIFVVLGISQLDNANQTVVDSIRCELSSLLGIQ
jgi:hypothetical protein